MNIAVIAFPGSNCETETLRVCEAAGHSATLRSASETTLNDFDAVVLPGGFAWGDYLRAGALAAHAPIVPALWEAAELGMPVLGICNGFQILTEIGLLPGALDRNLSQRFQSEWVDVAIDGAPTAWTAGITKSAGLRMPIAHASGRFVADDATLDELESTGRVVMRYLDRNPNGSYNDIAGICNVSGNVVGIMPHPERAATLDHPSTDGLALFTALTSGVLSA